MSRPPLPTWTAAALAGLAAVLAASPAFANTPQECIALWGGLYKSGQTQGIAQQDFMAACLAHKVTAAPPQVAPVGATGRCADGSYTTAAVPLGGCRLHGGLAALVQP
jgi:hypothetical protein